MAMDVTGLDDLFGTLDLLQNVGKKVGKKAVKEGTEVALKSLKRYAPRDSGDGADSLKVVSIKSYKSGNVWGKCGIDSTNFKESGHLWYQNYGYSNWGLNNKGKPVTKNIGWIQSAFEKCKNEAENKIIKTVSQEIDKILK